MAKTKRTVFLTGGTGNMGWAGFQELYARKERFDIRLLARDSKKNHKMLDRYASDPAVTVIWGDLTRYEDVLAGVNGADIVLHVGGMVSPAADYFPEKTLKVNVSAAENVAKAALVQPNADAGWKTLSQEPQEHRGSGGGTDPTLHPALRRLTGFNSSHLCVSHTHCLTQSFPGRLHCKDRMQSSALGVIQT